MDIFSLIRSGKSRQATDLHMVVGTPATFRINGALEPAKRRENTSTAIWSLTLVIHYLMSVVCDAMPLNSAGLSALPCACCHQMSPPWMNWNCPWYVKILP